MERKRNPEYTKLAVKFAKDSAVMETIAKNQTVIDVDPDEETITVYTPYLTVNGCDYTVCPGEYIAEWITESKVNADAVATAADMDIEEFSNVLDGMIPVTVEMAKKIARITAELSDTGLNAEFLSRVEDSYEQDLKDMAMDRLDHSCTH